VLFVVCRVEGSLVGVSGAHMQELRAMPSFLYVEIFHTTPGKAVKKTIDCFTWAGLVKLFHVDAAQLAKDYDRIREMEETGLFVVA
jgi:hypothetical protein